MRPLLVVLLLAIALPAAADEAAPAQERLQVEPHIKPGNGLMLPDPKAVDEDKPVGHPGPSGYWTGYRPARGGAYRWRMMGVGVVVLGITIVLLVRMLRKVSRARAS